MRTRPTHDVTQGSLPRNIWHLAWPNTITQLLSMLPGVYDAIWLGQLGHEAQAAVGLATAARITMISLLMALSLGSGAVVSRYVGARDQENANLAALQAVIMMLVTSGTLGLAGAILARPLMLLAGADSATLPLAIRYAQILFGGLIAMEMVPSVGFMLAAAGAPKVMMAMTIFSAGTLFISEPFLVKWLGIEGAALALTGGNTLGMIWGLGVLVSGRGPVRIDPKNMKIDLSMMGRILRVALPAIIQRGTPNLAMSILMRLISTYGAPVVAAWTVTQRIFSVATIPCMGLYRSTGAMVGQNLGAKQPERAERAVRLIARSSVWIGVGILALLALAAPQIMALFSDDPETIQVGTFVLRAFGLQSLALNTGFVFDGGLGGAGDTVSPMVLNLISIWLVQVPLAVVLPRWLGLAAYGVWIALIVGRVVQWVLLWLRFNQGKWKLKKI